MPTPTGLPKPGEIWERRVKLPPDWALQTFEVEVIERGTGAYWSLRVKEPSGKISLWVDASYWASRGELVFVRVKGK